MVIRIQEMENLVSAVDFWNDSVQAQATMKKLSNLNKTVEDWESLDSRIELAIEMLDLIELDHDPEIFQEVLSETNEIQHTLDTLSFRLNFSGQYDSGGAILAIHAGAGGVDSQDWASMLLRMYTRWSDHNGSDPQILDVSYGEESGVKSVVLQINGDYVYGNLKSEKGVHRLVRISPFDNDHARHTSFALVEVLPQVDQSVEVDLNDDDLKIDVFRAGGHGGQNVQKNSTAIRITHVPSGIVVVCQNERSQRQNKEIAMRILMSRLLDLEQQKQNEKINELKGKHISAEWGNQIRSYVLHPYQMVKDHRTGIETSKTEAVLNGEINDFIKSYLTYLVGNKNS